MAKLTDKFYNRIIEGQLELDASEQAEQDASAVKAVEGASAGTIDKALGLSSQGKLVKGDFPSELPAVAGNAGKVLKVNSGATGVEWGSVSGGTQLYKHNLKITHSDGFHYIDFISDKNTDIDTLDKLKQVLSLSITALDYKQPLAVGNVIDSGVSENSRIGIVLLMGHNFQNALYIKYYSSTNLSISEVTLSSPTFNDAVTPL